MGKLKIFLSYHKNTPIYKSDVFTPVQVGTALNNLSLPFAVKDNTGDNISALNPYYCELTGHYWVLKNYLDKAEEDYIGFAHYRRLPDLPKVSDEDLPSIYGMKYSESLKFFDYLNGEDLYGICEKYDIICPCSCYMYKQTVNPVLRESEPHFNVYNHFKEEHNNDCLDILKMVIDEYYPDFSSALDICFKSEKSYFYNIYIMKKEILRDFLSWEFDVLDKVGLKLKSKEKFKDIKYGRMAGFVGECLINVWLFKYPNYKIGHCPIYMIDFESDYIENANRYHLEGEYDKEKQELKNLLNITNDKFSVLYSLINVCNLSDDKSGLSENIELAEKYAVEAEQYYMLAQAYMECFPESDVKVCELFEKTLLLNPKEKIYAKSFLNYCEKKHDIEMTCKAWDNLLKFDLDEVEKSKYENFRKIYNLINNKK